MQIQLRQTEIVEALKQYVASQGFNLQGKTVEIAFTAGRKEGGGLTADVAIEAAAQLPELSSDEKPTLSVVSNETAKDSQVSAATASLATDATETKAAAPAVSLFGG